MIDGLDTNDANIARTSEARPRRPRAMIVAVVVLAFCCLCWGLSFPVMQMASSVLERGVSSVLGLPAGPRVKVATSATFNGWRFSSAAAVYFLLTLHRQRGYRRQDWLGGILVGTLLGGGMFLQLVGLKYTLPSVSGFLTSLAVVMVPVGQVCVFRQRVRAAIWLAVGVALMGMVVLGQSNLGAVTGQTLANLPPIPLLGEVLTVLAAAVFSAQILAVDRLAPAADPIKLTTVAMAVTGLLNATGALLLGGGAFYNGKLVAFLAHDMAFVGSALALVFICSVMAFHLMNIYQPRVSAATASVIYCLEPLFATMFSVLFRTERLTLITMVGGSIILIAVLIAVRASRPARA